MPPDISAVAQLGWIARSHAVASRPGLQGTSFFGRAADWAAAVGAPRQIVEQIKSPVGAADSTEVGPYGISIGAWSDSARTASVFYRLLSEAFVRMPLHVPIGMVVGTTAGHLVNEGAATPVGRIRFANVQLQPQKALALIVCTDTFLRDVGAAGQSLFNRELLSAIAAAVDSAFISQLIDTDSPSFASTSPLVDLRKLLLGVNSVGTPRLYFVGSPDVGKLGSTLATNSPAFAAASAGGGELANLPFIISSGLAPGTLALLDGSGIAANGLAPTVEATSTADIQMDSAPSMSSTTPTSSATVVSLFQTNSAAIKATAVFAIEKLRADAISVCTNISGTTWPTT
jgi:hypothetical protein